MHHSFFPALWLFMLMAFVSPVSMRAQIWDCDTSLAPERWSEPVRMPDRVNVKLGILGGGVKYFPSFAPDGKTLFYYSTYPAQRIMQTTLNDTGWTDPVLMPAVADRDLVRGTAMAPDWKTFYYVSTSGEGWDIYYKKWDEELSVWGPELRLAKTGREPITGIESDSAVNSPYTEWTVQVSPDGKKLYYSSDGCWNCLGPQACGGRHDIYYSEWDSTLGRWGRKCNLGFHINFNIHCPSPGPQASSEDDSPTFTADGKKMYFSKWLEHPYNYELYVSYLDSSGNWGRAMRLNINSYADTNRIESGLDYLPAVTPDGLTLVFAGRRNTMINGWQEELYISHLVVDENGDSVATSIGETTPFIPSELQLTVYPNPFTYTMAIRLHIDRTDDVQIRVYNMYGGLIDTIYDERLTSGEHTFTWDGYSTEGIRIPKGMYFISASTSAGTVVRTIVYL